MKMDKKEIVITCPVCGTEYLPAEIFYPNEFFGRPQGIDKLRGKIENFDGTSMNLEESYQCDNCNHYFNVQTKIQFKTSEITKFDMNKGYSTPLFEQKLTLFEGE